jgi:hypothetical protein
VTLGFGALATVSDQTVLSLLVEHRHLEPGQPVGDGVGAVPDRDAVERLLGPRSSSHHGSSSLAVWETVLSL